MTKHPFAYTNYPFLRIVVPFAIGILAFGAFPCYELQMSLAVAIVICLVGRLTIKKTYRISLWHVATNSLYFLAFVYIGALFAYVNEPGQLPEDYIDSTKSFTCSVEEIRQKDFSTEVIANADICAKRHRILLTIIHNDYHINVGDVLTCHDSLSPISKPTTPYAFDYSRYMHHKGILYEGTLESGEYAIIGHENSFNYYADKARQHIVKLIRLSGMDSGVASIAIVFCTGDRRYLPESDKEAFSQAGLAHIIAVSGLHIGVIIAILSLLLCPLNKKRFNRIKAILTLSCIWAYVVFTGSPSSAIRAAIMVSFIYSSKIFLHKHSSINALCAAAFFILLFSPNAIYEVGFQLSFLAVIGIILWSNVIFPRFKNPVIKFITASLSVSIAAQLATASLIIHYFNYFPTGFFIANLAIIPILPVFLFIIIAAIVLAAAGFSCGLLVSASSVIYNYILSISNLCKHYLPPISHIWIDPLSVALISALVIALGIFLKFKHTKKQVAVCVLLFCAAITSVFSNRFLTPDSGHFIESNFESTEIVAFHSKKLFIMNSLNDTAQSSKYLERADKFLSVYGIDTVVKANTRTIDRDVLFSYPFVWISGKSYMFVAGNLRRRHKAGNPIRVNYAILTRRYYNQLPDLNDYVIADTIIFPQEIYKTRRDTLVDYARRHKIPYIAY